MKKIFISAGLAVGLVACAPSADTPVAMLKEQKDSLKTVYAEIKAQIIEINEEIKRLDTTKVKLKPVTVTPAEIGTFEHFFVVHGNVDTKENILLYPESMGRIKKINVEAGASVSKGQIIAELDASTLESGISELKTSLELATSVFERQEKLWDKKIGSEMDFLQAKANKESLQKKLNTMYEQLDMFKVKAPISGYVDEVFPNVGEMAAPQAPFVRLINTQDIEIKSDISEDYITKIGKGNLVKVQIPGSDNKFESSIETVGAFINPNNRTFKATIKLDNGRGLKPNQLAKIHVRDFVLDSAVIVPSRVIQQNRKGEQFLFVVNGDKVEKKFITSDWSYEGSAYVREGLVGGEILVDKGSRSVQEQEQVKVVQ
jgi:RND family efflux transporter MFP subunit